MPKRKPNVRFTDRGLLPWEYRQAFLHYTKKLAPEALEAVQELRRAYQELARVNSGSAELDGWIKGEIPDGFRPAAVLDEILAGRPELAEEAAWEAALDLRDRFAAFIENYGLTADWLKDGIVIGLARPVGSPELASISHAWFPAHGEDLTLRVEGWTIEEDWQEFEERARLAFESALEGVRAETINRFKEGGYKKTTKPPSFTSVKWLVLWTVMRTDKAAILKLIKKERPSTMTIEDLKKEFSKLAKFGLPVRRSTRRRGKSIH